ncbi:MAG: respiratory nitrate reductase subunit gamma [Rhodospirillales bacterium]|nr:respiratory nitrate reductase subunit gamma [Rhodospirillales bacterium]MCW8862394.1 respiratory nitrate reductase subunit gamma [Rhodospirillales bacterium]MCW8952078.1 respiratory nitrate reductase subunit gamma [Rhodospirillales bacterium]MCW8969783.1 respiratory nitrate reductase subunit gamma [Rhodospirillales bacterium]MCW9002960.1 respiratory nitrate reductase subunit gamma [Rhodospirillales bacterium]
MSTLTVFFALLFYAATTILVGGLAFKIRQYWVTPSPLKIPTTPAPLTRSGAAVRVAREVVFFESLFKSNKWIWIFAALFHAALALVLLRHFRYFIEPVWTWVVLVQPFGIYAGIVMVVGLMGLWARRILVDRVRYITGPSDHLMLLLLVGIGVSGLSMKFVAHTDIIQVKAFFLGLMRFDWQPLPSDPNLLIHLGLVALLMILFPFSKLLHVPGVFFSPTRNQPDDAREKRHLAPWAAPLDAQRDN